MPSSLRYAMPRSWAGANHPAWAGRTPDASGGRGASEAPESVAAQGSGLQNFGTRMLRGPGGVRSVRSGGLHQLAYDVVRKLGPERRLAYAFSAPDGPWRLQTSNSCLTRSTALFLLENRGGRFPRPTRLTQDARPRSPVGGAAAGGFRPAVPRRSPRRDGTRLGSGLW